jgi:uncharacterized protein (TIGR02145 family)
MYIAPATSIIYFRAKVVAGYCDPFISSTVTVLSYSYCEVETAAIDNITAISATSGGVITSDGGSAVIAKGIVWSTTQNPTLEENEHYSEDGTGTDEFTSELTELVQSTNYYVRAYATNTAGTSYGQQISFTTLDGIISLTTADAINITATSAQSGGEITDDGGAPVTTRGVVWNITENPTLEDNEGYTEDGTGVDEFVSELTELTPNTTYFVRAYASNVAGNGYGQEVSFTTLDGIISLTTAEAINITATSAQSGGEITDDGGAPVTTRGVVWNITENPTLEDNEGYTEDGTGVGEFVSELTELTPNTNYYLRAYATNSVMTEYGNEIYFSTLAALPQITTTEATSITATTAVSGGEIAYDGGASVTESGIVWSTTENPTLEENEGYTDNGTGTGEFVSELTELTPNTTYYVRAFASNVAGNGYGQEVSFITLDGIISLTTADITNITATSAQGGGEITDDGGAPVISRGVVWNTTENPTLDENGGFTEDGTGTGEFVSELTGLTQSTTYYVRAYATNSVGTGYGDQLSFETLAEPFVCGDNITFIYNGTEVTYGTVTGENGTCWFDRNLGATRAATSSTDTEAYGDLYQWGRAADGHQIRTSVTTSALSDSDTPDHGSFVLAPNNPYDWRSPQNSNLWQGVNGINNPCPSGFRLPTDGEWFEERQSWSTNDSEGAFASPLKLPVAGYRYYSDGSLRSVGTDGRYWTSTVDGTYSRFLLFNSSNAYMSIDNRANGYSVRCIKDYESEPTLPTVTTANITNIGATTATGGGNVTDDGGAAITARGVCWSTTENPTIEENEGYTEDGTGTGEFVSELTELEPSTTYHVMAYATNSVGTDYGEQQTFSTFAVMDIDGNGYTSVVIGDQEWMAQNLKTTKHNDGSDIPYVTYNATWAGLSTPAYCWYNNDQTTYGNTYGALYNWYAVNTGNLCPTGWHLPTDSESYTMENDIDPTISDPNATGWRGTNGGTKLKATSGWNSGGNGTDSYGFSALPGGHRYDHDGTFDSMGRYGGWWSSTEVGATDAWSRYLGYDNEGVYRNYYDKRSGIYVRCVKDSESEPTLPTVTTANISNITSSDATGGGNVTDDGGAEVTARGVVWSTTENPTLESNEGSTEDGTGTGLFVSELTDLEPSTTYYVRAYATNSVGTAYSEELQFTTYYGSVTDIDGNIYYTVLIGEQIWTSKNLRVTKYNNGNFIPTGLDNNQWGSTTSGAYAIYPHVEIDGLNSDEEVVGAYGALYNWYAVDDSRGLCPIGWNVPSLDDWTQLVNYVVDQGYPNESSNPNGVANTLKSCRQINSPLEGDCATNQHPRWSSNETHYGFDVFRFSAFPGGQRNHVGGYENLSWYGSFLSATEADATNSRFLHIVFGHGCIFYLNDSKKFGQSVRCIKD